MASMDCGVYSRCSRISQLMIVSGVLSQHRNVSRELKIIVLTLTSIAIIVFLASCVITLSDGQGAVVFIFSAPIMAVLLFFAISLSQKIKSDERSVLRVDCFPKFFAGILVAFFVFAFIPGLREIPDSFMEFVGKAFTHVTGKSPYVFFKDRAAFQNKLDDELRTQSKIIFSDLDVTFAWDNVCIFGPYTNNEKAKSVLKTNWNIEERSQIYYSDSINALVFIYQGNVNQVVDLKRGIADFQNVDICLSRSRANFEVELDANGHRQLKLVK